MNNIFLICLSVFHAFNLSDVSEGSKTYCEVLSANRTECNIYQKILKICQYYPAKPGAEVSKRKVPSQSHETENTFAIGAMKSAEPATKSRIPGNCKEDTS